MNKIIEKLKTDRKLLFVIIILILAIFFVPYLTIPGLILWWFYKKSKFSKKFKTIATSVVGGLIVILMTLVFVAYANDQEPHLIVSEPSANANIQAKEVTIKGTYDPIDRKVWINDKRITASNGSFENIYQLSEGENKIEVSAGNWKRAKVSLVVIRELTEEEKAARLTPTPTPTSTPDPIPTPTQEPSKAPVVQKQATPTPTPTAAATPIAQTDREKMLVILKTNASNKWGDDYRMVKYEYDNQVEAYDWVMAQTKYPDIMAKAKTKWGNDYRMVKYEYENQVEAYESL